jgi:8-oxo-dGTP diphosphatase
VHHYEHASVRLHFFRIWDWQGEPQPQEGQQFAWQAPGQTSVEPMLPANGPILKSLQLPTVYAITCAHEIGVALQLQALADSPAYGLVQVREPDMDQQQLQAFVTEVAAIVHARGGKVVVNADPDWLTGWPVDGVHLNGSRLRHLAQRPDFALVGASVHSAEELQQAGGLGLDYTLLGHVQPTASHPGVTPLGWQGFAAVLADGIPLPVYALGGLTSSDLDRARQHAAHGVALMRGAWQ